METLALTSEPTLHFESSAVDPEALREAAPPKPPEEPLPPPELVVLEADAAAGTLSERLAQLRGHG